MMVQNISLTLQIRIFLYTRVQFKKFAHDEIHILFVSKNNFCYYVSLFLQMPKITAKH